MVATVFFEGPIRQDDRTIDCEEVRVIGNVVWATPTEGGDKAVIPLSNVAGVTGGSVSQEVEAIDAPGGQFTELSTDVR
jgi:hypothetical protein